jgi:hypothetical protein
VAYPYDGMFYPTLPQDTQDFGQVLSGVGRSLREIGRSTQYLPYDVLGAPVDLATLAMRPMGYTTERPVGGSDWLIELARQYGLADRPTGSGIETATRLATGITSPTAVPRAVGKFAQGLERASDITTEQANRAADALVRQITGNPTATAPQVLEATSMPFMQAVAPKAPSLLEAPAKSDLGFYSALEQATIPLQNKGTGSQFLAQIEKTAGVKPDEIKWTGLDEFLKSKPNVTKAEVQDYLAANRVDLQEVRLDTPQFTTENRLELESLFNIPRRERTPEQSSRVDELLAISDSEIDQPTTKFSKYTIPGGENYREILLTLPEKTRTKSFAEVNEGRAVRGAAPLTQERYDELVARGGLQDYAEGTYKSSHFDQPNILAHMRVNDRVVDGKNTLFIEEIQSDWHQAGRKKGYQQQTRPVSEIQKELDSLVTELRSKPGVSYAPSEEDWARYPEITSKYDALQSEWKEASKQKTRDVVPDAPFKTTWHELSLKRAIQEASEKGYDQIAFTTGKTQAERYDLSKQIGQITARPTPDGKVALEALTPDMREQVISRVVNVDELDDIVGKEISDKIRTQIRFPQNFDDRGKSVELSGLDLKIGGEGMKGFYDQILPKTLEKMGKKFDAKVGKADMDGVEVWKMDITPKMRESVLTKGQPLFAATPALPALGLLGGEEE